MNITFEKNSASTIGAWTMKVGDFAFYDTTNILYRSRNHLIDLTNDNVYPADSYFQVVPINSGTITIKV